MALRIRKDGRVLCARMHPMMTDDTYINDGLHYRLSVLEKVLVTEPMIRHAKHGQWWWKGNVPDEIKIDPFYNETNVNE